MTEIEPTPSQVWGACAWEFARDVPEGAPVVYGYGKGHWTTPMRLRPEKARVSVQFQPSAPPHRVSVEAVISGPHVFRDGSPSAPLGTGEARYWRDDHGFLVVRHSHALHGDGRAPQWLREWVHEVVPVALESLRASVDLAYAWWTGPDGVLTGPEEAPHLRLR